MALSNMSKTVWAAQCTEPFRVLTISFGLTRPEHHSTFVRTERLNSALECVEDVPPCVLCGHHDSCHKLC
jgi:hypothetical protein